MTSGRRIWGVALVGALGLGCLALSANAGSGATEPATISAVKADATYIGAKKCKKCHIKQNKTWKKTKHASTWDLLPEAYRKDEAVDEQGKACVSCHMTGYGKPGGPATMAEGQETKLEGTQCEACHGPGSAHADLAKEHKGKDPVPEVVTKSISKVLEGACVGCHNPHVSHEQYKEE